MDLDAPPAHAGEGPGAYADVPSGGTPPVLSPPLRAAAGFGAEQPAPVVKRIARIRVGGQLVQGDAEMLGLRRSGRKEIGEGVSGLSCIGKG